MGVTNSDNSQWSLFEKFVPTNNLELGKWKRLTKDSTENLIKFKFEMLPRLFTVIEESGLGAIQVSNINKESVLNYLKLFPENQVIQALTQTITEGKFEYPAGLDKETSEGVCLLLEALKTNTETAHIPVSGIFPVVDFLLEGKEFVSVKFEAKNSKIAHRSSIAPWLTKLKLDKGSEKYLQDLLTTATNPVKIKAWQEAFEEIGKSRYLKFRKYFEDNIETKELPEEKVRNAELKLNEEVPEILERYEQRVPGFKSWFALKMLVDLKFAKTKEDNWQSQFFKDKFTEIFEESNYSKIQARAVSDKSSCMFFLGGMKTNGKGFEYWDLSLNLMDYLAIYCINNSNVKDIASLLVRLYYKSLIFGISKELKVRKVTILDVGGSFEELLAGFGDECLNTFSGIETASIAGASISFGWDYNILHKVCGSEITWDKAWDKGLIKLGYYRIAAGNILVTSQRKDSYTSNEMLEGLKKEIYLKEPDKFFLEEHFEKSEEGWIKGNQELKVLPEGLYMLTEDKHNLWDKPLYFPQVQEKLSIKVEKKSLTSILKRKK